MGVLNLEGEIMKLYALTVLCLFSYSVISKAHPEDCLEPDILFDHEASCSERTSISDEKNVYYVVLAGGNGERLWPLSRKNKPKQFLSLNEDESGSIFESTLDRLEKVKGKKHFWAVTTQALYEPLQKLGNGRVEHYVVEPARRNTAPAILLTCLALAQKDPQAHVLFLPSDQYIPDSKAFAQTLNVLLDTPSSKGITLIGLKPERPATGYGYIKYDPTKEGVSPALGFFEKPKLDVAQEYVKSGTMLWNTGIFFGKVSDFIEEYKKHAPDVLEAIEAFLRGEGSYEDAPNTSIDYAVLEKSAAVNILPAAFAWSDIGSMPTYLSLKSEPKDRVTIALDAHDNFVQTDKKLVALIGVSGLCIAQTEDVLMVTQCQRAEEVKRVVAELVKDDKYQKYI